MKCSDRRPPRLDSIPKRDSPFSFFLVTSKDSKFEVLKSWIIMFAPELQKKSIGAKKLNFTAQVVGFEQKAADDGKSKYIIRSKWGDEPHAYERRFRNSDLSAFVSMLHKKNRAVKHLTPKLEIPKKSIFFSGWQSQMEERANIWQTCLNRLLLLKEEDADLGFALRVFLGLPATDVVVVDPEKEPERLSIKLDPKGDFEGNSDQSHNVEDWTKDRDDPNHSDDEM